MADGDLKMWKDRQLNLRWLKNEYLSFFTGKIVYEKVSRITFSNKRPIGLNVHLVCIHIYKVPNRKWMIMTLNNTCMIC